MPMNEKEIVTSDRFVELLNEELGRTSTYRDGMKFINVGTGYNFLAPMLLITENQNLDKLVFDHVSSKYTIAC